MPCARIARQCVKWGLGPAEFFAGIPGTLGGALAMNAGAWGGETWRHVIEVDVLDRRGMRHTRTPADYEIGYRRVKGPADEWFIAARLEFERKPGVNDATPFANCSSKRKQTQPIGEWSCGSVFTNPPGEHAARLIESAGLKGFRIGDASVSEKHANFIINHGARPRGRHRGADRARAAHRRRGSRNRARTPKCASSESRHELAQPQIGRPARALEPPTSARWPCCSAAIPPSARSRC